ncbi:hypothetical protein UQ49_10235 [Salmonella enterica subsp. diarizonae]|uniref:Uncharacterized protein n=1 Tax=Salmonella enterica TaxID=28901 RepID=A0A3F3IUL4_SALER|nr:hypothetical protein UQ50_10225 [Salmonella enterica subsp. diarizonae]OHF52405.1 hypothetical protein A7S32_04930 [Salmonella enterica subsp. diarizonae serovar 59:[k]:z35]OHF63922.1 hypothetical protein A7S96_16610 [Salmonella enterica subsp. diarizonae serovar 60:r:e,n,x,z15]OHG27844.1 hypothetical protein A7T58_20025 [Salmonella enterica subsp. diarizonae serovar 16:z10:e,n,x,z15]OHH12259.1 hypothetical protein A7R90_13845 [Salmonella enterica]OHK46005.1 hypothetical protein A7S73_17115
MTRWKTIFAAAQYYGIETEESSAVHYLASYRIYQ